MNELLKQPEKRPRVSPKNLIGKELDRRYIIKSIIGEGAMGIVFRATQLSIQRDVAIKILKLENFSNQDTLVRFQREMEIISSLSHSNIVRLLDYGRDDRLGVFYIAMELIEGLSVGDLIYALPRRLEPAFAIEIIYQLCSALTEPHKLGIIHRDIKPDNTLLLARSDNRVEVKVVDFGVARASSRDVSASRDASNPSSSRVTMYGSIVGTPAYMAPELCDGSGKIDARTDLYAVGVMLFELLTGEIPFSGDSATAILIKHMHEEPPALTSRLDTSDPVIEELSGLIKRLLHKDMDMRPSSALDVMQALDHIQDQHRIARVRVDATLPIADVFRDHIISLHEVGNTGDYVIRTTVIVADGPMTSDNIHVEALDKSARSKRRSYVEIFGAGQHISARARESFHATNDHDPGPRHTPEPGKMPLPTARIEADVDPTESVALDLTSGSTRYGVIIAGVLALLIVAAALVVVGMLQSGEAPSGEHLSANAKTMPRETTPGVATPRTTDSTPEEDAPVKVEPKVDPIIDADVPAVKPSKDPPPEDLLVSEPAPKTDDVSKKQARKKPRRPKKLDARDKKPGPTESPKASPQPPKSDGEKKNESKDLQKGMEWLYKN